MGSGAGEIQTEAKCDADFAGSCFTLHTTTQAQTQIISIEIMAHGFLLLYLLKCCFYNFINCILTIVELLLSSASFFISASYK